LRHVPCRLTLPFATTGARTPRLMSHLSAIVGGAGGAYVSQQPSLRTHRHSCAHHGQWGRATHAPSAMESRPVGVDHGVEARRPPLHSPSTSARRRTVAHSSSPQCRAPPAPSPMATIRIERATRRSGEQRGRRGEVRSAADAGRGGDGVAHPSAFSARSVLLHRGSGSREEHRGPRREGSSSAGHPLLSIFAAMSAPLR
jgi:hypothetical protein